MGGGGPAGGQAGKREGEGLLEEWGAQKEEKNTRLFGTHACNLHSNPSMPAWYMRASATIVLRGS